MMKRKDFTATEKKINFLQNEEMRRPEYSVYLSDYIDVGVFGEKEDKETNSI